jgi:hypothetical protein
MPWPPAGLCICAASPSKNARPALLEMRRHTAMHMIGREPVHLIDLDFEMVDCAIADILEFKSIGTVGTLVAYRPDQTCPTFSGQGKDCQEVGFVEIDM